MRHSCQSDYICWEDQDCIEAFVERNELDFDLWLADKGVDPRFAKQCNYWLSYCEDNASDFTDFGYEFNQDRLCDDADRHNDEVKLED